MVDSGVDLKGRKSLGSICLDMTEERDERRERMVWSTGRLYGHEKKIDLEIEVSASAHQEAVGMV